MILVIYITDVCTFIRKGRASWRSCINFNVLFEVFQYDETFRGNCCHAKPLFRCKSHWLFGSSHPYKKICNKKCCGYEIPFYVFGVWKAPLDSWILLQIFKVYLVFIHFHVIDIILILIPMGSFNTYYILSLARHKASFPPLFKSHWKINYRFCWIMSHKYNLF